MDTHTCTVVYYCLAFLLSWLVYNHPELGAEGAVGINYGLLGNNLPAPSKCISRVKEMKMKKIRVFEPDRDVLRALHRSGISVIVGTYNKDLKALATEESAAAAWVEANILPHQQWVKFTCVAAGNEVYPGELAQYVPGAMRNLAAAIGRANLSIAVSTAVSMQTLSTSYPPSAGAFAEGAKGLMGEIARFLAARRYPLLVNVYPYFARVGDPQHVDLDFALLRRGNTLVRDGGNTYLNLFDAMTDAAYAALEKVGGERVEIVVSETGWPSAGGRDATLQNARDYVTNLMAHVWSRKGTPRRPGKEIEAYIFAMFNENQKPEGVEQHWGMHYPNLTQVYHLHFPKRLTPRSRHPHINQTHF